MATESTSSSYLSNGVALYVPVIVLAGPHIASLSLHGEGDHVVNKAVFVPNIFFFERSSVVPKERKWCFGDN